MKIKMVEALSKMIKKSEESDRKRGVVFQEKYHKAEGGEERRREKKGRDNEGGIERDELSSGVNLSI